MTLFGVLTLVSVAFATGTLVFGDDRRGQTNVLARQISPLLLQQQELQNYRTVPVSTPIQVPVVAQPRIPFVAIPQRQSAQIALVREQPTQILQVAAAQPVVSGPIQAAIISQRSVQIVDAPSTGGIAPPQSIIIGPSVQPLNLEFLSQSSPVSVRQVHIPGQPNPPRFSSHEDEPDLLKQEIIKPIIHEVTEAIQPLRKITQEVRPVQESINQVIARGQQQVQTVAVPAVPQVQAVAVQAVPQVQVVAVRAVPQVQAVAVPALPQVQTAAEPVAETVISGPVNLIAGSLRTLLPSAKINRF